MAPSATLIDVSSITFSLSSTRRGNTPFMRKHEDAIAIRAAADGQVLSIYDYVVRSNWLPAVVYAACRYGAIDQATQERWRAVIGDPRSLPHFIEDTGMTDEYAALLRDQVRVERGTVKGVPLFTSKRKVSLSAGERVRLLLYRSSSRVAPIVLEQGTVGTIQGLIIRH